MFSLPLGAEEKKEMGEGIAAQGYRGLRTAIKLLLYSRTFNYLLRVARLPLSMVAVSWSMSRNSSSWWWCLIPILHSSPRTMTARTIEGNYCRAPYSQLLCKFENLEFSSENEWVRVPFPAGTCFVKQMFVLLIIQSSIYVRVCATDVPVLYGMCRKSDRSLI